MQTPQPVNYSHFLWTPGYIWHVGCWLTDDPSATNDPESDDEDEEDDDDVRFPWMYYS